MSYCRFQNTVRDLDDCFNNLWEVVSKEEHQARARLIKICQEIVDNSDNVPEKWEYQDEE